MRVENGLPESWQVLAALLLILLAGCASSSDNSSPALAGNPAILAGLPPLPMDDEKRQTAALVQDLQNGSAAVLKSAGAVVAGTDLSISAAPASLEWGMWMFPAGGNTPQAADISLTVDTGTSIWLGVSDYAAGHWVLSGPFPSSGPTTLSGLSGANVSSGGNAYLLIAAWDGTAATVNSLQLNSQSTPPAHSLSGSVSLNGAPLSGVVLTLIPGGLTATTGANGAFSIGGVSPGSYTLAPQLANHTFNPPSRAVIVAAADITGLNFNATFVPPTFSVSGHVAEGASSLSGVLLTLAPGSRSATTNPQGNFSITGVAAGSYTLTPTKAGYDFSPLSRSITVANSDLTLQDFSATAQSTGPTYISDIKPMMTTYCLRCHKETGFPASNGIRLGNYSQVFSNRTKSREQLTSQNMPPQAPFPSAAEIEMFVDWVVNGAPES